MFAKKTFQTKLISPSKWKNYIYNYIHYKPCKIFRITSYIVLTFTAHQIITQIQMLVKI